MVGEDAVKQVERGCKRKKLTEKLPTVASAFSRLPTFFARYTIAKKMFIGVA